MQHLEPLGIEQPAHHGNAGRIAARPGHGSNLARPDQVIRHGDDRNGLAGRLGSGDARYAERHEQLGAGCHQLGGERRQALALAVGKSELHAIVAPLLEAEVGHVPVEHAREEVARNGPDPQDADQRQVGLRVRQGGEECRCREQRAP